MRVSRFSLCLLLSIFANVNAFQQCPAAKTHSVKLGVSATEDNFPSRSEIDVAKLLAEVDELLAESKASRRGANIQKKEQLKKDFNDSSFSMGRNPWIATAVAGSIIGTVVGSPIVLAASLGFAGLQFLDSEDGKKNKKLLEQGFLLDSVNSAKKRRQDICLAEEMPQVSQMVQVQEEEQDISNVLAEAKSALEFAQDSAPSSNTIKNEISVIQTEISIIEKKQKEIKKQDTKHSTPPLSMEPDQVMGAAIVGSAVGLVVGSPLLLAASLGVAGYQLLNGEEATHNKRMLGLVSESVVENLNAAVESAKAEIEEKEVLETVGNGIVENWNAFVENAKSEIAKAQEHPWIPDHLVHFFQSRKNEKVDAIIRAHDSEEEIDHSKKTSSTFHLYQSSASTGRAIKKEYSHEHEEPVMVSPKIYMNGFKGPFGNREVEAAPVHNTMVETDQIGRSLTPLENMVQGVQSRLHKDQMGSKLHGHDVESLFNSAHYNTLHGAQGSVPSDEDGKAHTEPFNSLKEFMDLFKYKHVARHSTKVLKDSKESKVTRPFQTRASRVIDEILAERRY